MSDNGDGYDWSRAIFFGPVVTETKIKTIKGAKFITVSSPDGEGDTTISITRSSITRAEEFLRPRDQTSITPGANAPLLRRIKIIWIRCIGKIRLGTRRERAEALLRNHKSQQRRADRNQKPGGLGKPESLASPLDNGGLSSRRGNG